MKKYLIILLLASCTKQIEIKKSLGGDDINASDLAGVEVYKGKPVKPPLPPDTVIVITPLLPLSWSLNMPPVMNQGSEGSCNAMNVTYARSYLAGVVLSPEFLFNQSKSSASCTGSALITNLNLARDKGICTWAAMPYTWAGCDIQPTEAQNIEAAKYKIVSYSTIYATDKTTIKTLIAANRPLVFQVTADQSFIDAKAGFIWKTFTGAIGGHGITMCGYDDSKNAYKIINSFGTSWGDAGYSWIDYDFFPTVSSNLFVMNL